jgi:hypothetical protein
MCSQKKIILRQYGTIFVKFIKLELLLPALRISPFISLTLEGLQIIVTIICSGTWLPDGLFSNQKSQFG